MLIINVNYSYYSALLFRLSLSEKREIIQAKNSDTLTRPFKAERVRE